MRKRLLGSIIVLFTLTGCSNFESLDDYTLSNFIDTVFTVNVGKDDMEREITDPIYSEYEKSEAYRKVNEVNERFDHHIVKYQKLVDEIWEREGYYKKIDDSEDELTEREMLIDFYLFMEYHKDTQLRNLQFPQGLQEELLLIETLFAKKSIEYIAEQEFTEYKLLRDDLVKIYREMYREEMINILFEGNEQVIIMDRVPNIINRYNEEFVNVGLEEQLRYYLGIPDTLISRGMGLDLITLYSEMGYLPEGDIKRLAILLTTEMKLDGISMRLEKFFYISNSLEGMAKDIEELRKDVDAVTLSENMKWIRIRMNRAIDHLEELYLFYKGDKQFENISDVFIDLETREDFYAINLLSENIREIMDQEKYWDELDNIREELAKSRKGKVEYEY